jgi:1-deoxy-D-xylulose 5-phosphate reductoisomerase
MLVAAFLDEQIGFLDIPRGLEFCLGTVAGNQAPLTLQAALDADKQARELASNYILRKQGRV